MSKVTILNVEPSNLVEWQEKTEKSIQSLYPDVAFYMTGNSENEDKDRQPWDTRNPDFAYSDNSVNNVMNSNSNSSLATPVKGGTSSVDGTSGQVLCNSPCSRHVIITGGTVDEKLTIVTTTVGGDKRVRPDFLKFVTEHVYQFDCECKKVCVLIEDCLSGAALSSLKALPEYKSHIREGHIRWLWRKIATHFTTDAFITSNTVQNYVLIDMELDKPKLDHSFMFVPGGDLNAHNTKWDNHLKVLVNLGWTLENGDHNHQYAIKYQRSVIHAYPDQFKKETNEGNHFKDNSLTYEKMKSIALSWEQQNRVLNAQLANPTGAVIKSAGAQDVGASKSKLRKQRQREKKAAAGHGNNTGNNNSNSKSSQPPASTTNTNNQKRAASANGAKPTDKSGCNCSVCGMNAGHDVSECPELSAAGRAKAIETLAAKKKYFEDKKGTGTRTTKKVQVTCLDESTKLDIASSCLSYVSTVMKDALPVSYDATVCKVISNRSRCGDLIIGLDTMSNANVVNAQVRNLLGELYYQRFSVKGWSGKDDPVDQYGYNNYMGEMLYSPTAETPLISLGRARQKCTVEWFDNSARCRITFRDNPQIVINFDMFLPTKNLGDTTNLLYGYIERDVFELLCAGNAVVKSGTAVPISEPINMRQCEYKAGLESLHLHECGHPGEQTMKNSLLNGAFIDAPITNNDVDLGVLIRGGPCGSCLMGKSTNKSVKPRSAMNPNQPHVVPPVINYEVLDRGGKHENGIILGVDLIFYESNVFVIAVEKHRKAMISVEHCKSKSAESVAVAVASILRSYDVVRANVIGVYNLHHPDNSVNASELNHPVSGMESDKDGAIVDVGLKLLPKHKISIDVLPAGEHVSYVDRMVRIVKERLGAQQSSIPYKLPAIAIPWLVIFVCNMINVFIAGGSTISAFTRHTGRRVYYNHITRFLFGECVVAHRPQIALRPGEANGEIGLYLGPHLGSDYAGYFLSFATNHVKIRRVMRSCLSVNLIEKFGPNPHACPVMNHAKSVATYLKDVRAAVKPISTSIPSIQSPSSVGMDHVRFSEIVDEDNPYTASNVQLGVNRIIDHDDSNVQSNNPVATPPIMGVIKTPEPMQHSERPGSGSINSSAVNLLNDFAAEAIVPPDILPAPPEPIMSVPVVPTVGDSIPIPTTAEMPVNVPVRQSLPRAAKKDPGYWRTIKKVVQYYSECSPAWSTVSLENHADRIIKAMHISKAKKVYGDKAMQAMIEEGVQFIKLNVAKPTRLTKKTAGSFFRSFGLINEKLNGEIKGRFVVGKSADGTPIDGGLDPSAPVIDIKLLYMMLAICLQEDLELEVWDVKGAFLKAFQVKKDIYVYVDRTMAKILVELKPEWSEYLDEDGGLMMEVLKAWYGMDTACALWNRDIHGTLTTNCGYVQHSKVKCLYSRVLSSGKRCYILLHVDDLGAMMPKGSGEHKRVLDLLQLKYDEMKVKRGDRVEYIGLELTRDRKNKTFLVTMSARIQKLIQEYNITGSVNNPGEPKFYNTEDEGSPSVNISEYRSLIMKERYVAALVVPECLFHVTYLATKQTKPTKQYWDAAFRILKYLNFVKNEGILIRAVGPNTDLKIYTDASTHAHSDYKSHGCRCVFIGNAGGCIYFNSNKQALTETSSSGSELIELDTGVNLGGYYQDVLREIGYDPTITYYQDNESVITLVSTGTCNYDKKRKHIGGKINSVKEYFDDVENNAELEKVDTADNTADIGTKPLYGRIFVKHRGTLRGYYITMK